MSSKSRSQSLHLGSRDGGTGELKLSHTTSLIFAWYIQSSARAYSCICEEEKEHFERLGRGVGGGITGLSKMCCAMLRCNALYCTVISCACVVLYLIVLCIVLSVL